MEEIIILDRPSAAASIKEAGFSFFAGMPMKV